ncbi:peptidyl-prolyl cis-trans isomerase [Tropicimonas isoalkanivorans]|uniref:PPIC-type PPIASE domain-containing protein n=1 Tax=Tropicimonas isoalkanivorans TaxID=441112 RepID=A0A1I1QTF3_9RHOB|nr:peptidylprolyl isomerase [Tropicimonas isoalkanivorans]SFD25305.1 PPIC-type PPIASE domain-containing protein [Tropicimonas isoalkanivorans]
MTPRRILTSPLLHFFVLGGLVFVLYGAMTPPGEGNAREDTLILSEPDAERLAAQFSATWMRKPTETELAGLMRDWAAEEALVREALSLGLDRGDAMVRNRLRQKMLFIAEAPAAAMSPDETELSAYYEANTERFARPGSLSFTQVPVPEETTEEDVAAMFAALEDDTAIAEMARSSLLPADIEGMAAPAVDRVFGTGFAAALADLPLKQWDGPVQSAYGRHLVRVTARSAPTLPPLGSVRDTVLSDWRAEEARKIREAFIDALLERYKVELPAPAEVLAR